MSKQVYTEREAAEVLGIAPYTLGKLRRNGRGPAHLMYEGVTVRYEASALDDYKRRSRSGSNEPEGWRRAMKRCAATLGMVEQWKAPAKAKSVITAQRAEILALLAENEQQENRT